MKIKEFFVVFMTLFVLLAVFSFLINDSLFNSVGNIVVEFENIPFSGEAGYSEKPNFKNSAFHENFTVEYERNWELFDFGDIGSKNLNSDKFIDNSEEIYAYKLKRGLYLLVTSLFCFFIVVIIVLMKMSLNNKRHVRKLSRRFSHRPFVS